MRCWVKVLLCSYIPEVNVETTKWIVQCSGVLMCKTLIPRLRVLSEFLFVHFDYGVFNEYASPEKCYFSS